MDILEVGSKVRFDPSRHSDIARTLLGIDPNQTYTVSSTESCSGINLICLQEFCDKVFDGGWFVKA